MRPAFSTTISITQLNRHTQLPDQAHKLYQPSEWYLIDGQQQWLFFLSQPCQELPEQPFHSNCPMLKLLRQVTESSGYESKLLQLQCVVSDHLIIELPSPRSRFHTLAEGIQLNRAYSLVD